MKNIAITCRRTGLVWAAWGIAISLTSLPAMAAPVLLTATTTYSESTTNMGTFGGYEWGSGQILGHNGEMVGGLYYSGGAGALTSASTSGSNFFSGRSAWGEAFFRWEIQLHPTAPVPASNVSYVFSYNANFADGSSSLLGAAAGGGNVGVVAQYYDRDLSRWTPLAIHSKPYTGSVSDSVVLDLGSLPATQEVDLTVVFHARSEAFTTWLIGVYATDTNLAFFDFRVSADDGRVIPEPSTISSITGGVVALGLWLLLRGNRAGFAALGGAR